MPGYQAGTRPPQGPHPAAPPDTMSSGAWRGDGWLLEGEMPGHSPPGSPSGCSPGMGNEKLEPWLLAGHSEGAGDPPAPAQLQRY